MFQKFSKKELLFIKAGALLSWLPSIFSRNSASKPRTGAKNLPKKLAAIKRSGLSIQRKQRTRCY